MTDEELIKKIADQQIQQIALQQQYKDNPLAMPPLTSKTRKQQDEEWREAIRRELHHKIHEKIKSTMNL